MAVHIDDLLQAGTSDQARLKKVRWRLFRQFRSRESIVAEFGERPEFHWRVGQESGRRDSRAIKLLLNAASLTDSAQGLDGNRSRRQGMDNRVCETVTLFPVSPPYPEKTRRRPRATACVSSQPGCGVGCSFCATGELGYRGNFSARQIAEQVYWSGCIAQQHGSRLRNVVFMGMGEPLHNTAAVIEAISLLTNDALFGLRPQHITVSTVGVPRAMYELIARHPQVKLALSLHAAESDLRRQLVPRAIADMTALRGCIQELNRMQVKHPVWLEVVLLEGINDQVEHARALLEFCKQLRVEVNLIPYNHAAGWQRFRPTCQAQREAFASVLRRHGIRCTLRTSLGADQQAACGQLALAGSNP